MTKTTADLIAELKAQPLDTVLPGPLEKGMFRPGDLIWIVKGCCSDFAGTDDGWLEAKPGDVEWQFSDGPPGHRGSSGDYLDHMFEAALRHHAGCRVNLDYAGDDLPAYDVDNIWPRLTEAEQAGYRKMDTATRHALLRRLGVPTHHNITRIVDADVYERAGPNVR